MLQSALLESSYRDSMIESMRRDLVEKGKDRSDTRTERSIFNLLTRSKPQKSVSQNTKSLSDRLSGSLGMALGLNLANFGLDLFDDDTDPTDERSGEGNILIDDKDTKEEMSTYGFDDENFELIQGEDGNYKIIPKNNNDTSGPGKSPFEPAFFSDDVSEAEAKRIIELEGQGIYGDEARDIIEKENQEKVKKIISQVLPFMDNVDSSNQENQKDLFDIRGLSNIEQVNKITNEGLAFNETFDVNLLETITPITDSFRPVEPGSGFFEVIDLRTFKGEGKKTPPKGGATTQLNNTIPKLNPSKSYSLFESFLKDHH